MFLTKLNPRRRGRSEVHVWLLSMPVCTGRASPATGYPPGAGVAFSPQVIIPRQTFESDVLASVSSPFCDSPPPENREIANELAHGLLSSIRVCGKCAGTQYKTSLNQPKTQMLNTMFSSRLRKN